MKPNRKEFFAAYETIMRYINDEEDTRKLFNSLLDFALRVCNREEEE